MSRAELSAMSEDERRQIAEDFERAHAAGKISDKVFAYGRIQGALARWYLDAWKAAGSPKIVPDDLMDGRPPIERVGIEAIDAALPFIVAPVEVFLTALSYHMSEYDDALEVAASRQRKCTEAAELIRKAAGLLKAADNDPLGLLAESLARWADKAHLGMVIPQGQGQGYQIVATQWEDALIGAFAPKRGTLSRDAAIIRAVAKFFPDDEQFFAAGGYAIIANVARVCGVERGNLRALVRSTIKEGKRRVPITPSKQAVADGPTDAKTKSLMRLFLNPK
jgi:hypothetical protein